MAIYNKQLDKYVATKYIKWDGTTITQTGRNKTEANNKLARAFERWKRQPLHRTDRGTLARPELANFINELVAKEELEKS